MSKFFLLIVCGCLLLSGCGGSMNSMGGAAPSISLSTATLTFGDEVTGTTSQPLIITVKNSGTATLSITTIAASTNFTETNDCAASLATGATCMITVNFSPSATGSLMGEISIADNATGSPHIISLSGMGTVGTAEDTLTGYCWGPLTHDPNHCGTGLDTMKCIAGKVAVSPTTTIGCLPPQSKLLDTSTACSFQTSSGLPGSGECIVQLTSTGGSCSVKGQECGAPQLPPCCSGLTCSPASTRAVCQ